MANTIRPPDPLVTTPTLAYAPYSGSEAVRRILHLAYRDCTTVLDLTYGAGRFWPDHHPRYPPRIRVSANRYPPPATWEEDEYWRTWSADFTDPTDVARIPKHHLVIYDPPHVADAGTGGHYARRYGTARGSVALESLIMRGMEAACSLATVGVLVKVTDHAHGGEWLALSRWAHEVALDRGMGLYCVLHTYRAPVTDPKWRTQRVPRSNGATYSAYRFDPRHRDFDREYARQEKARGTA